MDACADLAGRVALVTGASRGIGRAIALALAGAGADVVVNCRERVRSAEEAADAVRAKGRRALAIAADVSDARAVEGMVRSAEAELGPVDVLVNNAGVAIPRDLDELTEEEFDRTLAVNLKGAFLCARAVLPGMRARRWGRIVNISSGAARGAGVDRRALQRVQGRARRAHPRLRRTRRQGRRHRQCGGSPSLIETDMIGARRDEYARKVPIGRLGMPDEVARAVLMVVGNAYMTGQTVPVNGGLHFN